MEKAPGDMRENKHTYPCQHCADRTLGCHGVCKEYAEAKAYDKKRKEQMKKDMPPAIYPSSFNS